MQNLSGWERHFSIGNWMLDNQHRNILILCRHMVDRIADGRSFETVGEELLAVSAEHFAAEEKLLEITGYADLAGHCAEHRRMLASLEQQFDAVSSGRIDPEALSDYLSGWCLEHILGSDRQFSRFIQVRH
ncbi:bacteriohemerythrin [Azonexus sp.]|uniref:bacteriohemerythrin n=1 Tax=Azonexus sp. TaxID=1872668 RepID=UPI0035B3B04F